MIALIDGSGNRVVEYSYDAWGKPIQKTGTMASTLGTLQPFRYRGYVWDEETGLYYLRSRYYKAVIFRFLSNDVIVSKIGEQLSTNAYIYSKNNSVVCADADGTDCYYVIYDNRENGKEKGLRLQGEWAISFLESIGHDT